MIYILPFLFVLLFSIFKDQDKIISIYSIIIIIFLSLISTIGINKLNILFLILLLYWLLNTTYTNKNLHSTLSVLFTSLFGIGSLLIFSSNSLYSYYLSIEYITFIILIYINLNIQNKNPGILYYLFSGLFSALFILTCGYLSMGYYISYSFLILVFLWKLNFIPFHFLIPYIYNNLSPKLIFLIDIPYKILLFYLFYRILLSISINFFFIIIINIVISTIIMLIENNLINILFYSSLINNTLLLILIYFNNWNSFLLYLIFYSFMVLIFLHLLINRFIVLNFYINNINPYYILFWSILLFNLIGIPPLNGFLIKLLPLYLLLFNDSYFIFILIFLSLLLISFVYLKILITYIIMYQNVEENNNYIDDIDLTQYYRGSHFISSLLVFISFPFLLI